MRYLKLSLLVLFAFATTMAFGPFKWQSRQVIVSPQVVEAAGGEYVLIAWNDLGMHCISPSFDQMAILPPYNNLLAQVIKRGDPPQVVTSGITVEYMFKKNTTVTGKTNFWENARALFGVDLAPGIGLTGNGLSGAFKVNGDHFEATGIPILPLNDKLVWNPFQSAFVKLRDSTGAVLSKNTVVVPISDEMHCDKCHANGGVAAVGINTGSVDGNILTLHDQKAGTALMASRPVLCASCHSDNALGTPGTPNVPSMSLAMHGKHATLGVNQPACYDCHPGPLTQCNRSALPAMGQVLGDPKCDTCHGSLAQVSDSIRQGRQPWLQEPTCAQCHGVTRSTGDLLYRNARGHGGVYCSACHNSPHAWYPSQKSVDNWQPETLQGSSNAIGNCSVCHTSSMSGSNPHNAGVHPSNWREKHGDNVERNGTSSCTKCHGADLRGGWGPSCYRCHGAVWLGDGGGEN